MIIMDNLSGLTLKHTMEDVKHVRITSHNIIFWDGYVLHDRPVPKPYIEFTVYELRDLMEELERRVRMKVLRTKADDIENELKS